MKKIIFSLFVLSIIGCAPKTAEVATPVKKETEVSKEETKTTTAFPSADIADGSVLYNAHCGKCHDLPVISKYSKEKWQKIVPSMAREAKLDSTQESRILSFVNWKLQQQ